MLVIKRVALLLRLVLPFLEESGGDCVLTFFYLSSIINEMIILKATERWF